MILSRLKQLFSIVMRTWFFRLSFAFRPAMTKALRKNQRFKNRYAGQRCFVLGNGPSLKDLDLSVLQNEYTFTVNQIARRSDFPSLKTNFHFWADPQFFRIDDSNPEDRELLNVMKSVSTDENSPDVFFPINFKAFTEKHHLTKEMNCNYYLPQGVRRLKKINYCNPVYSFHTVVQYCITMAIYMGFSEIYLLGCENTAILQNIHAALDEQTTEYGYQISENEQKRIKKAHTHVTMTNCAYSFYRTLKDYELIARYCAEHHICIKNCTPNSIIDSIPKAILSEVIHHNS